MSLDDARRRITPRTRAIMVMHYGGYAIDLPPWRQLADEHGLLLFEDAAHMRRPDRRTGTVSDAAAFSFFTNKNMTTAEGGMVVVQDEARRRARPPAAGARDDREHAGPRPRPRGRLRRRRVRPQLPDGRAARGAGPGPDRAAAGLEPDPRRARWRGTGRGWPRRCRRSACRSTPATRPRATSCRWCCPTGCDRTAVMAAMRDAGRADEHALPGHPRVRLLPRAGSAASRSRTPSASAGGS